MRKFPYSLLALLLAGAAPVWAVSISSTGERGDSNRITTTVRNNSGSALTSGAVVVWDSSPDAVANEGAWVTTTTSADSNLVAGVVEDDSIADGALGTIVVYGPIIANYANATDGSADTAGTAVGTTTVAGQYGNGTGLGVIIAGTAPVGVGDLTRLKIFVNPSNAE